MKRGSELLNNLPRLNYIKCDIEGYEPIVLTELSEIIKKHLPILQIETWGENKSKVITIMNNLDYVPYLFVNNKLQKYYDGQTIQGDFLFIHQSRQIQYN
jgi:hypothetical protein